MLHLLVTLLTFPSSHSAFAQDAGISDVAQIVDMVKDCEPTVNDPDFQKALQEKPERGQNHAVEFTKALQQIVKDDPGVRGGAVLNDVTSWNNRRNESEASRTELGAICSKWAEDRGKQSGSESEADRMKLKKQNEAVENFRNASKDMVSKLKTARDHLELVQKKLVSAKLNPKARRCSLGLGGALNIVNEAREKEIKLTETVATHCKSVMKK